MYTEERSNIIDGNTDEPSSDVPSANSRGFGATCETPIEFFDCNANSSC